MLFFSDVRAHALPGQRTQVIAKEFFLKEIDRAGEKAVVKRTWRSFRGPGFDSQIPHGGSQRF